MSSLYDRADIYDLIENEKRAEIIRNDWKLFLAERQIGTFLDIIAVATVEGSHGFMTADDLQAFA